MAKRKHSTALFEVITPAKSYHKPRERKVDQPSLFVTAGKWLQNHLHRPASTPSVVVRATAERTQPAYVAAPIIPEHSPLLIDPHDVDPTPHEAEAIADSSEYQSPIAHHSSTVAVAVDPERRRISFHMSYSAAIVAICALAMIVGLAIIAGQKISRNNFPVLSSKSTTELREGPSHPEVMDVARRPITSPEKGAGNVAAHPTLPPTVDQHNNIDTPRLVTPTNGLDGKRYIGLNYVIVQSYPMAEEKMARDAAALLNKEGISCTVETGVKGYLPITVVGLQAFDKQSTAPFKAYVARIVQISNKYAANSHSYKAFTPVAKKWDKQDGV